MQSELAFAHRLTAILYEKLAGNPRRIKRFLNDMNIRRTIAARRGIQLNADVVAKMMTLEVLLPEQFGEVLSWLRTSELRDQLTALENLAHNSQSAGDVKSEDGGDAPVVTDEVVLSSEKQSAAPAAKAAAKASKKIAKVAAASESTGEVEAIEDRPLESKSATYNFTDDLVRWAKLEPPLADVDLSPYLHLAASFSGDLLVSEELPQRLRDIVHQLNATGPLANNAASKVAAGLPLDDARVLIGFFARRARDRVQEQRGAVTAIGRLATAHPTLHPIAVDAFRRLPVEDLQAPTVMYLKTLTHVHGIEAALDSLAARAPEGSAKLALASTMPTGGGH